MIGYICIVGLQHQGKKKKIELKVKLFPAVGREKKKRREKCGFIEKAQEHRCDSLTGLLAIVCSDGSNGKCDRLGKRQNVKGRRKLSKRTEREIWEGR